MKAQRANQIEPEAVVVAVQHGAAHRLDRVRDGNFGQVATPDQWGRIVVLFPDVAGAP